MKSQLASNQLNPLIRGSNGASNNSSEKVLAAATQPRVLQQCLVIVMVLAVLIVAGLQATSRKGSIGLTVRPEVQVKSNVTTGSVAEEDASQTLDAPTTEIAVPPEKGEVTTPIEVTEETESSVTEHEESQEDEPSSSSSYSSSSSTSAQALLNDMIQKFEMARNRMTDTLKTDYGADLYDQIFEHNVAGERERIGRSGLASLDEQKTGWIRVQRKLMMKLLQVLMLQRERKNKHRHRVLRATTWDSSANPDRIPFIWATGGHSASAGHGNLFNESYTAFMERIAHAVFQSVGLELVGRNYAMGGMSSTPELGLCVEAVYGLDIDVLSWDFGMTDGRNYEKMEFYFTHAGMHPNRPAVVAFVGGRGAGGQLEALKHLEDAGLPVLHVAESVTSKAMNDIPDSAQLTQDEIQQLAPFARNFKCSGGIEKGDPLCGEEKYTKDICPVRRFKTSWHPGW